MCVAAVVAGSPSPELRWCTNYEPVYISARKVQLITCIIALYIHTLYTGVWVKALCPDPDPSAPSVPPLLPTHPPTHRRVCAALKGQQWLPLSYLADILMLDSQKQAQELCQAYGLTVGPMPDGGARGVCLDKVLSLSPLVWARALHLCCPPLASPLPLPPLPLALGSCRAPCLYQIM